MAWDKEKDRALAHRATLGRILHRADRGTYTKPRLIPKGTVPAVANLTKKIKVRV